MKSRVFFCIIFIVAGCTTAYGPESMTGGYRERLIDDNTYIVSFFGNGHTPEQQVWNYWLYRCAELTLEKGYNYFDLEPSNDHAAFQDLPELAYQFTMLDQPENAPSLQPAYYYYYTVTTYSSKAFVHMYNDPVPDAVTAPLYAEKVKELLQPYLDSKARINPPDRRVIFLRAGIEAMIKSKRIDAREAEKMEESQI
jgi:hypothetical protein